MSDSSRLSRRRFLQTAFTFSAAASLSGCGWGTAKASNLDPVDDTPTHYLVLGDWGWSGSLTAQNLVSTAMQAYVAKWKINTDLVFLLGDNFYGALRGGASSSRWQTQFESVYPASSFDCPFYAVLGNHDYQIDPVDKVSAELAYAATGKSRFTMPGRYSRFVYPPVNPVITFILLDSNMPNEPAQPPPTANSGFYTQTQAQRQQQLSWLTDALSQPLTTPFLSVMAHHPLYTNGGHGDNATLIDDWDPLLRSSGAHLYMAGHDHDLQHLEFKGHPTSFVLSGGGGASLSALTNKEYGPFADEVHGVTHVQVTSSLITVRHLDIKGNVVHKFTKTPDGTVSILI